MSLISRVLPLQQRAMVEPLTQLSNILNDPFFREWTPSALTSRIPAVDIEENDNQFMIKADVPGFEKEQVHIDVQGNSVIISGRNEKEQEKTENQVYTRERTMNDFKRTITLPQNIEKDQIKACMKNGVLEVQVPKHTQSTQRVQIE
jgi:HSP20 family protein